MTAPESSLHVALLAWYGRARRELPWRATRDPYAIWVSETMLQQTRVGTAIPYYERFLRALPTVRALAEATEEQVLSLWSGLGYYRRARMLHAAAARVVREHASRLPESAEALRGLEGVGAYTAGAVASIAFGERAAVVDGNVARVLARVRGIAEDVRSGAGHRRVWSLAKELVAAAPGEPGDWNQALMELGATVCTPRTPACPRCPVAGHCVALRRGIQGELPRLARKRPPRPVDMVAVVLASREAVLLARRASGGLFAGLWEPPSTDRQDADVEEAAAVARLRLTTRALLRAGEVDHVLSHRKLHVVVMSGPLGRRLRWSVPRPDYDAIEVVDRARLPRLPLSALARKILAIADAPPGPARPGTVTRGGAPR